MFTFKEEYSMIEIWIKQKDIGKNGFLNKNNLFRNLLMMKGNLLSNNISSSKLLKCIKINVKISKTSNQEIYIAALEIYTDKKMQN